MNVGFGFFKLNYLNSTSSGHIMTGVWTQSEVMEIEDQLVTF